ncbi:hypothetical protein CBR_g19516 [Chara braunii]|uniref:Uncharacterized protein n=1 Tax=Chara braunii TaxID=69332 RepID=A0A388KYF1_CHABU|nr:hypothetical protein CBR_g19516 [Chara braunii]|eukprot:GBG75002.1 hypothetical protein CBR_g19516 [Chara braunii]
MDRLGGGELEQKGNEFYAKAIKKMKGFGWFSNKWEEAATLLEKAANNFKQAKAWNKAGEAYVKLAECHDRQQDSKHESASALVDAATAYKKVNPEASINCLREAVNKFREIGRLNMAARHIKDIAEIHEKSEDFASAMEFYEMAGDLFSAEEQNSTANQCKLKVASFAAQLEDYPKAIEIFEAVARESMDNNLLKYSVKNYLLQAGLCRLCQADPVAIDNSLKRFAEIDPTFSGTREHKFLVELAAACEAVDVPKFTQIVQEFDSMSRLDAWKTTLLLRTKKGLEEKEKNEDVLL